MPIHSNYPRTGTRTFEVKSIRAEEGSEEKKYRLSFSSETPYDRWFGREILSHAEGAVDLTRLNEIGVVLFGHNPYNPIGRVEKAWIENGKGEAIIALDEAPLSKQIAMQIDAGTLRAVSVGYDVGVWEEVEEGHKSKDGRFDGPCVIAVDWTPLEISIVSVPADAGVGVGRDVCAEDTARHILHFLGEEEKEKMKFKTGLREASATDTEEKVRAADDEQCEKKADDEEDEKVTVNETVDENVDKTVVEEDEDKDGKKAIASERERVREISSICREFDVNPDIYISKGTPVDTVRKAVMDKLIKEKAPVGSRPEVVKDEQDKFRDAAADSLLLRAGLRLEKPAEGANQMRSMSLRELGIECLERDGMQASELRRIDNVRLFNRLSRAFFTPEAAFPAILDQTIEKSYVQGLKTAPVTFDQWTKKGSLPDFKKHDNHYIAGPVGEFFEVPENGELKHDSFSDAKLPQRQLRTFGRQFTLSRKAFIDDDIGLVTSLPARYAASARKTINRQVYEILVKNATIYDGTALFTKAHKNSIKTGTGITMDAMQTMIMTLANQTDQFGQPALINPAYLIVPAGMKFAIAVLFDSPVIETENNTQAVNPMYQYRSQIKVIEDPTLNSLAGVDNACPWFLVGQATDCETIEVDYLNGREVPYLERMQAPGQLGFQWDIYLDWGISVMDFRGIVRNPGVKIEAPLELL